MGAGGSGTSCDSFESNTDTVNDGNVTEKALVTALNDWVGTNNGYYKWAANSALNNGFPYFVNMTYAYNTPEAIEVNGVRATVSYEPASPQGASTSITATITLSGTATAMGTHTVNLKSTKAGLNKTAQTIIASPNKY